MSVENENLIDELLDARARQVAIGSRPATDDPQGLIAEWEDARDEVEQLRKKVLDRMRS